MPSRDPETGQFVSSGTGSSSSSGRRRRRSKSLMAGIFNGRNRSITNLANLALLALFLKSEITLIHDLVAANTSNQGVLNQYIDEQLFGLPTGGDFEISKGISGRYGHSGRAAAIIGNEAKKFAMKKMQVQ